MSAEEVDRYLRDLEEPKRSTLEALRRAILEIVPQAEQVISYGVPAFRVEGRTVAGIAAFKNLWGALTHPGRGIVQFVGGSSLCNPHARATAA